MDTSVKLVANPAAIYLKCVQLSRFLAQILVMKKIVTIENFTKYFRKEGTDLCHKILPQDSNVKLQQRFSNCEAPPKGGGGG